MEGSSRWEWNGREGEDKRRRGERRKRALKVENRGRPGWVRLHFRWWIAMRGQPKFGRVTCRWIPLDVMRRVPGRQFSVEGLWSGTMMDGGALFNFF
jgi:hypothetical protein